MSEIPSFPTSPECVSGIRLVHITAVPGALNFLLGQVGAMKAHGVEESKRSLRLAKSWMPSRRRRELMSIQIAMQRRITPRRDLVSLHRLWGLLRHRRPQIVHSHTPKGVCLG